MFNELNRSVAPGAVYIKLSALTGHKPIRVSKISFQDGKYGTNALLYAPEENFYVVMPKWCNRLLGEITATPEMLTAVLHGHMGIGNIREIETANGKTVTFDYMDM